MSRTIGATGLAAWILLGILGGAPARAGSVTLEDSVGTTWGGEYLATVVTGFQNHPAGSSFLTFCLERDEHIYFAGHEYTVVIGEEASRGGLGGPEPDPLDSMTAYLYHAFRAGSLADPSGNLYGAGTAWQDVLDANDLQNAIWYIEQETADQGSWMASGLLADFDPDFNRYTRVAYDAVHGSGASWSGLADVRVMQLYDANGDWAQDQLALVHAPLPAGAAPGIALLLGLALMRARRRRIRPI